MKGKFAVFMGNLFGLLFGFIALSCLAAVPAFVVVSLLEHPLIHLLGGTCHTVFITMDVFFTIIIFILFMKNRSGTFGNLSHN